MSYIAYITWRRNLFISQRLKDRKGDNNNRTKEKREENKKMYYIRKKNKLC